MADGRDYFRASIDLSQFDKDAASMRKSFSDISRNAESEGAKIDATMKKIGVTIAGVFTIQKATQFVKEIANVRGEFQQLEIAFETMLGSKDKADALMSQLIDTAARTPFDLIGVANGAKQLLAYGTASDKVNETLIRLGDVAAGLSIPLNDLVYLYGTTQVQGRLFTKDIHQFMGRGIPVVKELSKELGVSEVKINEMVTAGKIGFPELQKVFENLTNEGGMFSNLMEKQSASITGQIANMEDAWDVMLNDLGTKSEDAFTSAIDTSTYLIENYETIGEVLGGIIVTYGAYKAAVIAVNMVQSMQTQIALQSALAGKSLTLTQGMQAVSARALSGAQATLNKTMLANPYVLATMALVGLGYAMYKMVNYQTDAEKATKELNGSLESERALLDVLIDRFNRAEKGTKKYDEAKKDLNGKYKEALTSIGLEVDALYRSKTGYELLTAEIEKNTTAKIRNKYTEQFADESGEDIGKSYTNIRNKVLKEINGEAGREVFKSIKDIVESSDINTSGIDLSKQFKELGLEWRDYSKEVYSILSSQYSLKLKIAEIDDIFSYSGTSTKGEAGEEAQIKSLAEQTDEANKAVVALKQELQDLLSGKISSEDYAKDIEDKAKELKAAEDKLNYILTGSATSKDGQGDIEKKKKNAQDKADLAQKIYNDEIKSEFDARSAELDNQQKTLNLLDDGFDKKLKQIELNHKKEILGIEQRAQELIIARQQAEKDTWESEGSKGTFVAKTQTASDLPVQIKTDLIEADSLANKLMEKATDDLLKELIQKYQTYEKQRIQIIQKYGAERVVLTSKNKDGQFDENIEELNKKEREELAQFDTLVQDKTSILTRMFADMSDKSIEELKLIRNEAISLWEFLSNGEWNSGKGLSLGITKEQFEDIIADPTKLAQFKKGLDGIKDAVTAIDRPLEKIKEGFKELFESDSGDTKKQREGLDKITEGYNQYADAAGLVGSALSNIADLTGSEELGAVAEGISDALSVGSDIMSGATTGAALGGPVGAAIGAAVGLVKGVTGILSRNKKAREEQKKQIEENQEKEYFGQLEIEAIYRQKYEWAKKIGEATLNYIKREGDELKKQGEANYKTQTELLKKLQKEKYKSGERFEKTGLFGWGSGKIVEEWSSLGNKSFEEIEKLASQGKLSAEAQKFYEALKKAKDEGADIEEMQVQYLEKLKETFTGTTYESLVSGIVNAFKQGKRSAVDFAQSFEELMQGAVESSLQLLADEKMRQWYEDFAKAGEDGYTKDEIEKAKKDWIKLNENLAEEAKQLEEVTGIKIGEVENQGGASYGAYEKISQEQASSIDGSLTGIHIENVSQTSLLSGIGERMHEMRNISLDSWGELISIRKNTSMIKETNEKLDKVIKNTASL